MTTSPNARPLPDPPRKGSTLVLTLLGMCWLATPVLLYGAAIMGASFFGEAPSADDMQTSRRRLGVWLFGGAFTLTVAAALWVVLATNG